MGCFFKCGDGAVRWLFPIVLILSADYEEQCAFHIRTFILSVADVMSTGALWL
jgi:hypothetical protein